MRGRDNLKITIERLIERGWSDEEILSGFHPNILGAATIKLRKARAKSAETARPQPLNPEA